MRIHVEERGQDRIPPQAEFDRLQAGKQAPWLFVEQAVEQENGGFEFIGRDLEGGRVRDQRDGIGRAPGSDLILRSLSLNRSYESRPRSGLRSIVSVRIWEPSFL